MTVRRRQNSEQIEEALASQLDNIQEPQQPELKNEASQYLGQTLTHAVGAGMRSNVASDLAESKGLSKIGDKIGQTCLTDFIANL